MAILSILKGAANAATGGLLNMAMSGYEDNRQREQQQKLQHDQIQGAKEIGDYNLQNNLNMLKSQDKARLEGIKNAGLNPALMYGGSGAGGQTISGTGTPTGATAGDPNHGVANAIQLGMMKAQTENIEADTELKKAGAIKTAGVDTELATQNTAIAKAAAEVANRTVDEQVSRIYWETQEEIWKAKEQQAKGIIAGGTIDAEVSKIKTEAAGALLNNILTQNKISLTKTEQEAIITKIKQEWERLRQGNEQNEIRKFSEEIKANYPSLNQMSGHTLQQITYGIADVISDKHQGETEQKNRAVKFK